MRLLKSSRSLLVWWLGFCLVAVGLELSYFYGILDFIYYNDSTKLSIVIAFILVWQSLSCGLELKKQGAYLERNTTLERGWFYSDVVLSIGMIGTVIGFIIMLGGFENLDLSDIASAQQMITQLGTGMSTALITTVVGLVTSVLLKLQFFMLENHLRSRDV